MPVNREAYQQISQELAEKNITLVAVSKTKPAEEIQTLLALGQIDFGENYVQELVDKAGKLPTTIRWHFIGHLQSNKVKSIAPFIHLIHGVDSYKLLQEINRQARRFNRVLSCLLQVHIAQEETKFGLDEDELAATIQAFSAGDLPNIRICGLMGMASFSDDRELVRQEFRYLKSLFDKYRSNPALRENFTTLSMGMSSDYRIAIEEGSTMVRIGSLLFGARS